MCRPIRTCILIHLYVDVFDIQNEKVLNSVCTVYVEMADLLREFTDPAVMDLKMGVR